MTRRVSSFARVVLGLTIALGVLAIRPNAQSTVPQLPGVRHYSGDNVAPVFEGWEKNADGSFNLVFGYLNRNYEEEPEIAIGPANNFSPGPADRGQPTHFYPRRQQFMFKVHVPADFGKQELVWTLTRDGRTEKAVAHLALEWELTEVVYSQNRAGLNRDSVTAKPNAPPTISSAARTPIAAVTSNPVALSFSASDDGQPAPPAPRPAAAAARRSGPPPEPALINIRQGPVQQQIIKPSRQGLNGHVDAMARVGNGEIRSAIDARQGRNGDHAGDVQCARHLRHSRVCRRWRVVGRRRRDGHRQRLLETYRTLKRRGNAANRRVRRKSLGRSISALSGVFWVPSS